MVIKGPPMRQAGTILRVRPVPVMQSLLSQFTIRFKSEKPLGPDAKKESAANLPGLMLDYAAMDD